MKIKFIKEYRAIGDFGMPGKAIIARSLIGDTADNLDDEDAQWLIDNGFAEEVKELSWKKPNRGDSYYFINGAGVIIGTVWMDNQQDRVRYSMGNCFRTIKAAERYGKYLQAIVTVRQDEGVLTPEQVATTSYIYYIRADGESQLVVHGFNADYTSVNTLAFNTREHAQTSLDKHLDEWRIIANYDWSRE